ncbi:hypothetical protein Tco_0942930 [Tanacetum coccineum]
MSLRAVEVLTAERVFLDYMHRSGRRIDEFRKLGWNSVGTCSDRRLIACAVWDSSDVKKISCQHLVRGASGDQDSSVSGIERSVESITSGRSTL